LAKLIFGAANFATQLAAQPPDDPTDVLTVTLSGFGPRQAGPRVAKRSRDQLRSDKKFRIQRNLRVTAVNVPKNRGGRGPDSRRGTTSHPVALSSQKAFSIRSAR